MGRRFNSSRRHQFWWKITLLGGFYITPLAASVAVIAWQFSLLPVSSFCRLFPPARLKKSDDIQNFSICMTLYTCLSKSLNLHGFASTYWFNLINLLHRFWQDYKKSFNTGWSSEGDNAKGKADQISDRQNAPAKGGQARLLFWRAHLGN